MGQLRKLPFSAVIRHTPISNKQYKKVMWHGDEILVRPLLTLDETFAFTTHVSDLCKDDDSGPFLPELVELAFRRTVIEMYAVVELPEDIDEQYYYLFGSDLYETVAKAVNTAQLNSLRKIIDLWMERAVFI